jgi:hypothetical protein
MPVRGRVAVRRYLIASLLPAPFPFLFLYIYLVMAVYIVIGVAWALERKLLNSMFMICLTNYSLRREYTGYHQDSKDHYRYLHTTQQPPSTASTPESQLSKGYLSLCLKLPSHPNHCPSLIHPSKRRDRSLRLPIQCSHDVNRTKLDICNSNQCITRTRNYYSKPLTLCPSSMTGL